jgi:branched-chain amino acid transport system ATP-binding protein
MTRTFQRLELWESMTVYENVLTAAELGLRGKSGVRPRQAALDAIERLSLTEVQDSWVSALPTGTARLVEVARALASAPRLMLLDEPCAGLDNVETARLGEVLSDVVAGGTSILLVEHHVDMVFQHCSAVHVLDFGSLIASGTPREIQNDGAVRGAYLGGIVETPA